MKNVYDQVRHFYEEEIEEKPAICREWVEGFLRQKAWQGCSDAQLTELWNTLEMFIIYLLQSEHDFLEELSCREYSFAIEWLAGNMPDFECTLEGVRHFFAILIEFYNYLAAKKLIVGTEELEEAAKTIAGGNRLKLDSEVSATTFAPKPHAMLPEEVAQVVDTAIEQLMVKLGIFFQQQVYLEDFQRALFMYTGPFDTVPEDEDQEFWLGFWDYFLFDYHLLGDDLTPLNHFFKYNHQLLEADEQKIINDLLQSKFRVFYISGIIGHELVECTDLFTEETFQLPFPDFNYNTLKKLLFFGHVFAEGAVMVNYVTSVEISHNLRRRIKEEVIRQKAIYEQQQPGAQWRDFLSRHAILVRHTIDVLVSQAKVNVTPFNQLERLFPEIKRECQPNAAVIKVLNDAMPQYGFSYHDIILARKLWCDYSQLANVRVRKADAWAAAVIYTYAYLNTPHGMTADDLAGDLNVSPSTIYKNKDKLVEILQLAKYDARYLSEEGFLFSILMS